MKSLLELTSSLLHDCGRLCGVNPCRDILTVTRRVENEGASFITITLPTLSSALEKALAEGRWSPAHSTAFNCGRARSLPRFLGGFFDQVFDGSGVLRQPSPEVSRAIWAIRQVCRFGSKMYLNASAARVRKALRRFVDVETEVRDHAYPQQFSEIFTKVSAVVWSDILGGNAFERCYREYAPRHGRGTTAEAITGNDKYHFRSWPLRLEQVFPFSEFGVANILNPDADELARSISYPLPSEETPVKVTPVPKTAKTPRIIAIEPVAMQYMQQAIADWVRPRIEHLGRYTSGHVNFTSQLVNNQLAYKSSKDGLLATLDLSDASDRVSLRHVEMMLRSVPFFHEHIIATRSTRAKLPDGSCIHLSKFASMGSALCFPVEAMVFFIAIVSSLIARSGKAPSPSLIYRISRNVYVYGDDLIIPSDMAPSVVVDLELFGLKVNTAKSFWTGKFRESCGGDYYDGVNVTPVYLRRKIPSNRADVHGLVSSVAFANQLYWAGLWGTSRLVRSKIDKILGPLPCVEVSSQELGWESFSNARSFHGWSASYQRPKTRGWHAVPTKRTDVLDGDPALLKCYRVIGSKTIDSMHLRTSVRFGNLVLKRRWT